MHTCKRALSCLAVFSAFLLSFHPGALTQESAELSRLRQTIDTLSATIDGQRAFEAVAYFQRFWRHGGNDDFNQCMAHVAQQLRSNGYAERADLFRLSPATTEMGAAAWQPVSAELRLITPVDTLLQSLQQAKMTLCVNSHSTAAGGFRGQIVKYAGKGPITKNSLKGKILYTHLPAGAVYKNGILEGGAAGIISSYLPGYNQPEKYRNSIHMSSIPYNADVPAFGFNVSHATAALLDTLLRKGPVIAEASIRTAFRPKIVREVSAEIRGARLPEEYVVMIAHLDEPGANDNASGAGTLLEMAGTLQQLIAAHRLPRPARTLKFMWVEEIRTVRRWAKNDPDAFQKVKAAVVLDMVGEDIAKTGGTFLIEKMPDPSAIWTRPPDKHTEWGAGKVREAELHGSYLNDLFFYACGLRARQTGWIVRTNPFEGGSDHVPFLRRGIPAVLAWHFTDVFYHTSGDDLDKVSRREMANVGIATGATALFLANCTVDDAGQVLALLARRAAQRLQSETRTSKKRLQAAAKPETQVTDEVKIVRAWAKWYAEAFASVRALPITESKRGLEEAISNQTKQLENRLAGSIRAITDGAAAQKNPHP